MKMARYKSGEESSRNPVDMTTRQFRSLKRLETEDGDVESQVDSKYLRRLDY